MSQRDFDVAILGGGPTGSALALLLARATAHPERIALLQSDQNTQYGHAPGVDPRVLALNHGSKVLLEALGAWPDQAALIQTIHVSQRGRLGRTVIRHTDYQVPQLGSVVRYADLHATLARAVAASGVRILTGPAAHLAAQHHAGVQVTQGTATYHAALAVQADGSPTSPVKRVYRQMALLTSARATLPRLGWAFERFTREGPLAVLPHPSAPDQQAIVWCCAPDRARALQALDTRAFSRALTDTFGSRLGTFDVQAPVSTFPLLLNMRRSTVEGRLVAIGNAAQTLHPVAGQGLNLGLRDVAVLAIALRGWLTAPTTDPAPSLQQFERMRQPDRQLTAGLTDLMARAFATQWPIVEHAAGLTLLSMDLVPALRAPLARHLLQGLRL